MKILHTSDWHLGRNLYGRKRYEEFKLFLEWLFETIMKENIDALLICGDIFDTNTPSNKAQELYYQFLCQVSLSSCKDIIIIAGNHDSPSFLEAPKNLLSALNIHVIGTADITLKNSMEHEISTNWQENLPKEIILLKKNKNSPSKTQKQSLAQKEYKAIICAVPYLRDRDIRQSELGETFEQKNIKLLQGIQNHYTNIAKKAQEIQKIIQKKQGNCIPIIALGHLFVAGGITLQGDGVRDLYVGSLTSIGADTFSSAFDYVALGHLHIEQKVNKNEYIRYCGSPVAMSFGEANQIKKVYIFETKEDTDAAHFTKSIRSLEIPIFQTLMHISGDLEQIHTKIQNILSDTLHNEETVKETKNDLFKKSTSIWLEIEYTGKTPLSNLREELETYTLNSNLEILRIRNSTNYEQTLRVTHNIEEQKSLHDLSVHDVFEACLLAFDIPENEQKDLRKTYQEILHDIAENDIKSE